VADSESGHQSAKVKLRAYAAAGGNRAGDDLRQET